MVQPRSKDAALAELSSGFSLGPSRAMLFLARISMRSRRRNVQSVGACTPQPTRSPGRRSSKMAAGGWRNIWRGHERHRSSV